MTITEQQFALACYACISDTFVEDSAEKTIGWQVIVDQGYLAFKALDVRNKSRMLAWCRKFNIIVPEWMHESLQSEINLIAIRENKTKEYA